MGRFADIALDNRYQESGASVYRVQRSRKGRHAVEDNDRISGKYEEFRFPGFEQEYPYIHKQPAVRVRWIRIEELTTEIERNEDISCTFV